MEKEERRGFTSAGVFGAAGVVDAAQVRVTGRRPGRQVQLRMTIDTRMWGLSASLGDGDAIAATPAPGLSITASGVLRPLELRGRQALAVTVGSTDQIASGTPAGVSADGTTAVPTRRARIRVTAAARGVPPLATIAAAVAAVATTITAVAATYLAGKLAHRLRDVLLLMAVAGFLALILNPLVLSLQRWRIPRRGWAVAVVTVWAALVFIGLAGGLRLPAAARADPALASAAVVCPVRRARPWLDRSPAAALAPGRLGRPGMPRSCRASALTWRSLRR